MLENENILMRMKTRTRPLDLNSRPCWPQKLNITDWNHDNDIVLSIAIYYRDAGTAYKH